MAKKVSRKNVSSWEKMLAALVKFRTKHSHCRVPSKYKACPALGRWAATQRYKKKVGELSEEKIRALDKVGFVWELAQDAWARRYAELKKFKAKYGHCNVPEHWRENPVLANWVQSQRYMKKKGKLAKEHEQLLLQLGFQWFSAREEKKAVFPLVESSQKEENFEGERLYVLRHGVYVQHDGKSSLSKDIEEFRREHKGELPPFIPLPKGPAVFSLGDGFVKEKKVTWKGKGPLPPEVLEYVQRNGTLPKHEISCGTLRLRKNPRR